MATTNLTPEQEEYLAYIVSSAEQLKTVVSDILDFKQLGTEFALERHPLSVRDCLNEALQQSDINTISGSKAPGVQAYVSEDVPEYILSDRERIVQILVTLIHNSLRFTVRDERQVSISIETIPSTTIIETTDSPETPAFSPFITPFDTPLSLPLNTPFANTTPVDGPLNNPFDVALTIQPTQTPVYTTPINSIATATTTTSSSTLSLPSNTAIVTNTPPIYPKPSPRFSSPTVLIPSNASSPPLKSKVLQITVSDNGVGIEVSKLAEVFQSDSSLSKMKYIVELLGGEIRVNSDGQGKGTAVTVTMKVDVWVYPLHSPPRSTVPRSPSNIQNYISSTISRPPPSIIKQDFKFTGINVLLVEDNPMNQRVLRRLFGKLGITPDVASHGAEAVEYILKKRYDIVFMDLHMPVCDGFEATRQIQDLPPQHHKPHIYALTASVSAADKDKCLNLGMKGHLLKPVSVQALVEALRSVCCF